MSKYECKKSHKMKLELSETIARNKINLVDCIWVLQGRKNHLLPQIKQ